MAGVALDQEKTRSVAASLHQHRGRAVEPHDARHPAGKPPAEVPGPAAHLEHALRRGERSEEALEQRAFSQVGPPASGGGVPSLVAGRVALEESPGPGR
jgi:hypothetical protein